MRASPIGGDRDMRRDAFTWITPALSGRTRLRRPFAIGFLVGMVLSGAVLVRSSHSPTDGLTPILEETVPNWQPHPSGRREV